MQQSVKPMEWRINLPNGTTEVLEPQSGFLRRVWMSLENLVGKFISKFSNFFTKGWNIGLSDPRKFIHGIKVGVALTLVSLFYYMRPLYEGTGGNAMWAIMTVVVVFEQTVGATLSKCTNRSIATFIAGSLGLGVHYVATQSGDELEPVVLGFAVFIFGSAATFSRFIPTVKTRFDYGALVFILTFSLVSVSGYRVEKLMELAHQRLATIIIGTAMCILISILVCPIWAGKELHNLMYHNLEKLSDSLNGCIAQYFKDVDESTASEEDLTKKSQSYKCVLNTKAAEESMANFARWEPAHGTFNFRHPWRQYLKVGAAMRSCAYCIETLNGFTSSDIQAPVILKEHFKSTCVTLSSCSSDVMKELAFALKTMSRSTKIDFSLGEMKFAVHQLQNAMKAEHIMKGNAPPLMNELLPLLTLVSLLIELAARIQGVVVAVEELARLAGFKQAKDNKSKQDLLSLNPVTMTTPVKV